MDSSPHSPTSLLSFTSVPSLFPPAYSPCPAADHLWKIKNAKYQSTFVERGNPRLEDLRNHVEYIRNPHFTSAYGPSRERPTRESPSSINVQYNQVFCHLTELIDKFQCCITEISPLKEEDLLFLLLRRFADSSGAIVYAEIRRSEDFQVYDSTIEEPLDSVILEGSLSHDTSVIHADLSIKYSEPKGELVSDDIAYTLLPQTPSETRTTCAVTVNFPSVMPIGDSDSLESPLASPPEYTSPSDWTEVWPEHDWAQLPSKFQPPSFRIHRCHHSGVERGGEDDAFELPLGFPEIVQHMEEACGDVDHATFRIQDRSKQSLPQEEGSTQGFECDLFATIPSLYVTVQREGCSLVYRCFRDRENWISSHHGHEECAGC